MEIGLRVLLRLDHLGIGEQERAVVNGGELAAIKQFGGAQHIGIVAALQRVAQDQVAELDRKIGGRSLAPLRASAT